MKFESALKITQLSTAIISLFGVGSCSMGYVDQYGRSSRMSASYGSQGSGMAGMDIGFIQVIDSQGRPAEVPFRIPGRGELALIMGTSQNFGGISGGPPSGYSQSSATGYGPSVISSMTGYAQGSATGYGPSGPGGATGYGMQMAPPCSQQQYAAAPAPASFSSPQFASSGMFPALPQMGMGDKLKIKIKSKPQTVDIYRFFNNGAGDLSDHMLGTTPQPDYGYHLEGLSFRAFKNPGDGRVPIYQFFSPSAHDHFYTTDQAEADPGRMRSLGYTAGGILAYLYKNPQSDLIPVYRYWNPSIKDHFYTPNAAEIGTTTPGQSGKYLYISEGILGYAKPPKN